MLICSPQALRTCSSVARWLRRLVTRAQRNRKRDRSADIIVGEAEPSQRNKVCETRNAPWVRDSGGFQSCSSADIYRDQGLLTKHPATCVRCRHYTRLLSRVPTEYPLRTGRQSLKGGYFTCSAGGDFASNPKSPSIMRFFLHTCFLALCAVVATEAFVVAPARAGLSTVPSLREGSFVSSVPCVASLAIAEGRGDVAVSRPR